MDYRFQRLNVICIGRLFMLVGILCGFAAGPLLSPVNAAQNTTGPLDLVFVIDNSGSMKKNDPKFEIRQAIQDFVIVLPRQSRVGMVLFDENVRLLHRLRIISNPRVQKQFISSLEKIDYTGRYTDSPNGIERALYELKTNGRTASRKVLVFLTDGQVTIGDKDKNRQLTQWLKQDLTHELKQLGIRIYGVAFTDDADFSMIQSLASRTEGEYFRARDASQIAFAFARIRDYLKPLAAQPDIAPLPIISPEEGNTPSSAAENEGTREKPVVIVTHYPWILYIWLALISALLTAAVILFYTKFQKPKSGDARPSQPLIRMPKARLEDLNGACKSTTTTFTLDKAKFTVGRGDHSDIRIPQATISKHHAVIEYKNLAFYVMDLKSTNGTHINENRVPAHEPVRLKTGDRIGFGKFQFQFEMPEQVPFSETILLSRTSINDPQDQATIMIDLDETHNQEALVTCLQHHLMQIETLGSKYKTFVREQLDYDTLKALAIEGDRNLIKSQSDRQLHCNSQVRNKLFFLICSLPVATQDASKWYGAAYGGFTQFVLQWIKSDAYQSAQCNTLCIVTFGQTPTHWVSLTIVPSHNLPDPVEIISVDFLNAEEKSALALEQNSSSQVDAPAGETHG